MAITVLLCLATHE